MVNQTIRQARWLTWQTLEAEGIPSPGFESAVFLETVTGLSHDVLLRDPDALLTPEQLEQLTHLLHQRSEGVPLQYLCGTWDFYGLTFSVGEGVLIPRQDTETLVETVRGLRQGTGRTRLLDLCSGTGCIPCAIAAHLPGVTGACVEKSERAMGYLRKNLAQHAPQLEAILGDVCAPDDAFYRASADSYDVITCNPPYLSKEDMAHLQREVRFEPEMALYGGTDGMDFYRRLVPLWKPVLSRTGAMVFEVGAGQAAHVCRILEENGLTGCRSVADDTRTARIVLGQHST